jgi:hypothetical protein
MCWKNLALFPGQGLDSARLISFYIPFAVRDAPAPVPEDCRQTGLPGLDDDDDAVVATGATQSTGLPLIDDDSEESSSAAGTGWSHTPLTGLPDLDGSTDPCSDAPVLNEAAIVEVPLEERLEDGVWVLPVQLVGCDETEECHTELAVSPVQYLSLHPAATPHTPFLSIVKAQENLIPRNILSRAIAILFGLTEDISMACRLRLSRAENNALWLDGEGVVEADKMTVAFPKLRCEVTVRFVIHRTPRSAIIATAQLAAGLPPDAEGEVANVSSSQRD